MKHVIDNIMNALLVTALCALVISLFIIGTDAASILMAVAAACLCGAIVTRIDFDECQESYEEA